MLPDSQRLSVTRDVAAPAPRIFALLCDPQGHVQLDGSGMLVATGADRLTAVGDTFVVDMDREPLGDLPWGRYAVRNTVTQYVPDELLEWDVASMDHHKPLGHVYGYALERRGDDLTRVTSYCDWSRLNPKLRDRMTFPIVPAAMMERTLDNLVALVAR
ncbi:polyketide cyclase [Nocardioides sp.]|uniref:polyketide cyclase n=1 Tax=Nocardioides sp. TaxID=35761 RepID=UPI003D0B7C1C